MGRYKLPVPSDSNSTSSLNGPSTSSAADSRAWVAATAGFPKMSEFHFQCSEHYHPPLSALLSTEPAKPLDHHDRVHERDTVWWSVPLIHNESMPPWPRITTARCGSPMFSLLWSSLLKPFLQFVDARHPLASPRWRFTCILYHMLSPDIGCLLGHCRLIRFISKSSFTSIF